LNENLHPYVVFLPSSQKPKILGAIFGSKAAVDVLKFSLKQGIAKEIYQKDLMANLQYSNKTIIENLKQLTKLGLLNERMEKTKKDDRTVWVKVYNLSDSGRWFALLLAEEADLTQKEKTGILQDLFRTYIRWVKHLLGEMQMNKKSLETIFQEEMNRSEVAD
jgi:DNA-binding PadR family transcriptional regulator